MAGEIVHFEVPAADVDRASGFWSGLFGWNIGGSAMEGFDYRMFQVSDGLGGAVMPSEKAGSGVIIYYDTNDIDAAVSADDAGGFDPQLQLVAGVRVLVASKNEAQAKLLIAEANAGTA